MILILSDCNDQSTHETVDWIKHDFFILNENTHISKFSLNFTFKFSTKSFQSLYSLLAIDYEKIESFWYRRGDFIIVLNEVIIDNKLLFSQIYREWNVIKSFLHFTLRSKRHIGNFHKEESHNKLLDLFFAQEVGLTIPSTIVSSEKTDLENSCENSNGVITKAISNMFEINMPLNCQSIGTQLVEESYLNTLLKTAFPTLLQENIRKSFELRIFYLDNQFYSMAIFSQFNQITKIDYRNGNKMRLNRNVPYILPDEITEKLKLLMLKMNLNSGSIDMIVTPEDEYVFLEVNPTGQFGWVSENCNYYLEEKIAHCLEGRA